MTQEEILGKVRFQGELRGLVTTTLRRYLLQVKRFQKHYGKPADKLSTCDVQQYLYYLLTERRLQKTTVDANNMALRFCINVRWKLHWTRIRFHSTGKAAGCQIF